MKNGLRIFRLMILAVMVMLSGCSKKDGVSGSNKKNAVTKDEKADLYGTYWLNESQGNMGTYFYGLVFLEDGNAVYIKNSMSMTKKFDVENLKYDRIEGNWVFKKASDLQIEAYANQIGRKDKNDFTFDELFELGVYEKMFIDYSKVNLTRQRMVFELVSPDYFEKVTGYNVEKEGVGLRYSEAVLKNNIFYKRVDFIKNAIIGEWEEEYKGEMINTTFNEDLTGKFDTDRSAFTYKIKGSSITFTYIVNGNNFKWSSFNISDDGKELTYVEDGERFIMNKK